MCDNEANCCDEIKSSKWEDEKIRADYTESLKEIHNVLSKNHHCVRCNAQYNEYESLGRRKCLYHPDENTEKCICKTAQFSPHPTGSSIAFKVNLSLDRAPAYSGHSFIVNSAMRYGCTSIDHASNWSDANRLYAVMPSAVWQDLFLKQFDTRRLCASQRFSASRYGKKVHTAMQVYHVFTADQAYSECLRLAYFDAHREPLVLNLHELYDECAALFHFAPLESVSRSGLQKYLDEKRKENAPPRPLGDANSAHAAKQRELFNLGELDDLVLETPDFVPYVVILRSEFATIENVKS